MNERLVFVEAKSRGKHPRLAVAGWLLLAAGLVWAYADTVGWMWHRWFPAWETPGYSLYQRMVEGESYYTHGPLVPLLSAIVALLLIRGTRIVVRPSRLSGSLVLVASLLLHLMGCLARVHFVSGFSLIGVLAGLVLLLWGTMALRRLWFPVALLLFMVPLPEVTIAQLNFELKMLATRSGVTLANVVGVVAERSGNRVFLQGDKSLVIANICNGLRTLISVIGFAALYVYICRLRGLWRMLLLAASVPIAVASNALRVVSLIVVADIWNPQVATGFYHDFSGLLIFVMAFLLMFGLERLILGLRRLLGRPAEVLPLFQGMGRGPDDKGQVARMWAAVASRRGVAALVVVAAAAGAAAWLNQVRPPVWTGEMAAGALPKTINVDGQLWHSYPLTLDQQTLDILETRDYLYRRYTSPGSLSVDFCLIISKDNRKGTHPPDLCLQGSGEGVVHKGQVVLRGVESRGEVPCRELVVGAGWRDTYFLYTYMCGDRYTDSFWVQQFTILRNGLLNREAGGGLIRVSTPASDGLSAARERSKALLRVAVPYLDSTQP